MYWKPVDRPTNQTGEWVSVERSPIKVALGIVWGQVTEIKVCATAALRFLMGLFPTEVPWGLMSKENDIFGITKFKLNTCFKTA